MHDRPLTRRQALQTGAAALAGGAALFLTAAPAQAQAKSIPKANRPTWLLDPTGGGHQCKAGRKAGGCPACNACRHHAANKIFRSPKAADGNRAHRYCLCKIVAGPALPQDVYDSIFVKGETADRRDPRVAAILAAGPAQPVSVPMIAGVATPVVLLAAGGIGYAFWRRSQRRLATVAVAPAAGSTGSTGSTGLSAPSAPSSPSAPSAPSGPPDRE